MRFGGLGGWEWIIILVIVIIIFGVGKLPQAGAALGQSIREFRNAVSSKPEDDDKKSDAPAATETEDKV
jgi:sec-independent protein translocase protein TatA